jgi:hypothetical protein
MDRFGEVAVKLFHFHDPHDYDYARAGRRGTWYPDPGPGVCPECGVSRQELVPPLIIEWEPDSDVIGDFVWPGFDDTVVVSQRVRETFESHFRGFECKPVEMRQKASLKRPKRITKRTRPRVWLPYEGPPLWHLWVTASAHMDLKKSGYEVVKVCSTCGRVSYNNPSFEDRYFVVDMETWGGEDIFRLYPSGVVFCTPKVKDFVEDHGFTNVSFLEDGEIPV